MESSRMKLRLLASAAAASICAVSSGCTSDPVDWFWDPTSDWCPSSDWAAAGDRDASAEGGPGDGTGYGGYDAVADSAYDPGPGYPDATHDTAADAAYDPLPPDTAMDPWPPLEDPSPDPDADEEEDVGDEEDAMEGDEGTGIDGAEPPPPPPMDPVDPTPAPYVLYLSADDSNSQASPIIARKLMATSRLVPWSLVRVYEFLNYYDIGYAPADPGEVRVVTQLRAVDFLAGIYALQVGVQAPAVRAADRRAVNLTLVCDTSGSMTGEPMALEQEVLRAIASSLLPGDVVSMLEWDDFQSVHLSGHRVSGPGDPVLLSEIDSLAAGGSTNLEAGLSMGYDLATDNYSAGMMNRVILVSDGQANVGVVSEDLIARHADREEGEGIYLVGVGTGAGYNDTLMDAVTDAGRGAYIFVDTPAEAWKMFGESFVKSIEISAWEVRVALTLPGVFRIEEFHGEEYSAIPEEVRPQHLAPNDAMVFHQLLAASDPDAVQGSDEISAVVEWRDHPSGTVRSTGASDTLETLVKTPCPEMRKADAIVVFAQALMRISYAFETGDRAGARETCEDALAIVSDSAAALADSELADIAGQLSAYCNDIQIGILDTTTVYY